MYRVLVIVFFLLFTSCNVLKKKKYEIVRIDNIVDDWNEIYLQDIRQPKKVYRISSIKTDSIINKGRLLKIGDTLSVKLKYSKGRAMFKKKNKLLFSKDTSMYGNIRVNLDYYLLCLNGLYYDENCDKDKFPRFY